MLSARQTLSRMFILMIFREVDMDTLYMQLLMVMWCCKAKQPFKSRQSTWKVFEKTNNSWNRIEHHFPEPPWFFKPRWPSWIPTNLLLKHTTSRHGFGRFTPRIRLRKKSGKKKVIPFGMAMKNGPFAVAFPTRNGDFPLPCHVSSEGTYTPREIQGTFVDFWGCCWNTKYDQIKFYVYYFLGTS